MKLQQYIIEKCAMAKFQGGQPIGRRARRLGTRALATSRGVRRNLLGRPRERAGLDVGSEQLRNDEPEDTI